MNIYDLIIIGGGPAGLTSGIFAGRAKLKTALFTGTQGGEISLAIFIDDFPGFPEGITGPQLVKLLTQQNNKFGTELITQDVTRVNFSEYPFKIYSAANKEYLAKAVIISSGATNRWLGLEKEQELLGHGVSSCAVCDGAFFKDKVVAVVGGGDVAIENALYLSKYAKKIYLIHWLNEFQAAKILQDEIYHNPKIEIFFNTEVKKLEGEKMLEGIIIENNKTHERKSLEVAGLFVAIGFVPNIKFLGGQLAVTDEHYLKTTDNVKTSIPGVFAAGDVCDFKYRQAITASGFGAMAALEAIKWLRENQN
ncbi:MAG: thioredoxin-disulfide reductase [Candidatus Pacebacteria bacterium]|nr:thioredoxin-disulfide reductase [Candidatus Paceibacterota bacterium]